MPNTPHHPSQPAPQPPARPLRGRKRAGWLCLLGLAAAAGLLAKWAFARPDGPPAESASQKIQNFATGQTNLLHLTAEELNGLTGQYRPQARPQRRYTLGILAEDDSLQVGMEVYHQAWRLRQLGDALGEHLSTRTALNLVCSRGTPPADLLGSAQADFMVVDACSWHELAAALPGATPLACLLNTNQVAIFTREGSALHRPEDLRDSSLALPDPRHSATLAAKAWLSDTGITAGKLRVCITVTNRQASSPPGRTVISQLETVVKVQSGQCDAGVSLLRSIDPNSRQKLVILATLPDLPAVVAARPGLRPEVAQAFQQALLSLNQRRLPSGMPDAARLKFSAFGETEAARLRRARDAAARFDAPAAP